PKLGILAGGGALPPRIIQSCQKAGRKFFVIAFEGQTDPAIFANDAVPHAWVRLGAAGTTLKHLRAVGVQELVMAGAIKRPGLKDLRPDMWATKFFASSGAASLGDDGLLKALIKALEGEGFSVVGVDQLLPDIIAPAGVYGAVSPTPQMLTDIDVARHAALSIGAEDKGQGAIAFGGTLKAVEDENGTDAMIGRVGKGGVLVKVCKPGQETRVDLPSIGVATVEAAAKAGLDGIAIQAGKALVIDLQAVIAAADRLGLFVTGIEVDAPLIYVIAGEASGDILGGRLMASLKERNSDLRFVGIGGLKMAEQGLESLFPMQELSLMGLAEILPHLPRLLRRINQTVADVVRQQPQVLLTIDAPGFCFRVARKLKGRNIKLVHYVAPSVWAWKPGRAKKVSTFLDHLLTLLPFEPPYFQRYGLATTFVGHSVVDGEASNGDGEEFRKRYNIDAQVPLMVLLPGSRVGEIEKLLPVFCQTAQILSTSHQGLKIVIPTLASLTDNVTRAVKAWPMEVLIVEGDADKFDAFAAADIALAASGTVALELAMAGTPTVIGYKVHPVTAWLIKKMIKTPYVNLVNIVLGREAVPELLQEKCRPDLLAGALNGLLDNENAASEQIDAANQALKQLGRNGPSPSGIAADTILSIIKGDTQT
ncbi:MAG: lipid-A-disaccharide synthase, partial [Rhodospirillales bacterium]|nr:lipid-A-disaccharide synthase [Rhodospirillales bacterium]